MMMKGESLSDTDTDYCKNSQTSNKNNEERRKPLWHGRNERGGRGGRVPPTIFCGGDRPPHFRPNDVGGTVPPTVWKLIFSSIKFAFSSKFLKTSSYKICMWWFSDKHESFTYIPVFKNQWLVNGQDDQKDLDEFQLTDGKFKVSNIIHMKKSTICLENTTDTKLALIVFSS